MQEATREALSLLNAFAVVVWVAVVIIAIAAVNELRIRRLERLYNAERRSWWRF